jgi:hypothetical protein
VDRRPQESGFLPLAEDIRLDYEGGERYAGDAVSISWSKAALCESVFQACLTMEICEEKERCWI